MTTAPGTPPNAHAALPEVDGLTFTAWYAKVDRIVSATAGLGIDDLADGPSYDSWSAGETAREYAIERLQEEGFPL